MEAGSPACQFRCTDISASYLVAEWLSYCDGGQKAQIDCHGYRIAI